ncbi:50S ribosomal protein L3 [Nannocystis sp. ILAH1]|uniref:50S ribosomal protein L3 n=1 Tax=unclassified Nannocystis TaxID=2627009 RepID=UPI00226FE7CA|nr:MULTISPECIES: 50S ribosomal protein L3 [unclassified Nannocystis]MCY0993609.1 50S ribosomal protein L3 [Nannocystis sp. ILAH1]MCY1063665.1 50S ribosomal protein L3 [Nannocystis sp. RBIL2]
MNFQIGLIAKKLGMTQVFKDEGDRVPVTVLHVTGNTVTAHRTDERDTYTALQVGFAEKKANRASKPEKGAAEAAKVGTFYVHKEFRVPAAALAAHPVGSQLGADLFKEGTRVDITGTSKGKGYQGVIKRHNMEGEKNSHGQHEFFRHGGSIGCRKTPGRVHRGKRMTGHMGHERVTLQNLEVVKIDAERGLVLVRGPIPGPNNGFVTIRAAVKPAIKAGNNKG